MSSADAWHDPAHAAAYRRRVFGERERLRAACADPRGNQERVLAELVEFNAATAFGAAHGLDRVRSLDDLRKAVPVQDYAAHEPWIERVAAGETNVLSADEPRVFFTSSGSTGAHKKIPVTPRFVASTFLPFYFAAWAPLIESFPEVLDRPDAVLNLKHDPIAAPPTTSSGSPHVGASQVDFGDVFGEPLSAEPGTSAPWATLPIDVPADAHLDKMYLRLRLAVESDIRLIIGINPAMVAAVPYQLRLWWPRIVQEVRDGTLGGRPYGSPNPARAAELARIEDVRPAAVWPRIRAIFCWPTGVASLYLPRLREEFGVGVTVLPAPVAASEGPTAVALDRHPTAGSLVVTASVYEFIDADSDIAADVATLEQHELEAGRDYHVIFSHVGGFYRYAVGDVVHVVDRIGGVPRMAYAGRATRSDVAGERLRDAQVVRALGAAVAGTGLELRNAACRASTRYEFALEPRTAWSERETQTFESILDDALAGGSGGYRAARAERRLGAPTVRPVEADAFMARWQESVATGVRPTQVKDRLFRQDDLSWRQLVGNA